MLRPRLYKWEINEDTIGLLFFAQVIDELLFEHTIDSFKAPALNTHLQCLELCSLGIELRNGGIKSAVITPCLEELKFRVHNDPVIKKNLTLFNEYILTLENSLKNNNSEEFLATIYAFRSYLNDNYWLQLRREIEETIKIPKEQKN